MIIATAGPSKQVLAFGGDSDEGEHFNVYLTVGAPAGTLEMTLQDGTRWSTAIGLDEICLFKSKREDLMALYIDEMLLNAKAATRPRVH